MPGLPTGSISIADIYNYRQALGQTPGSHSLNDNSIRVATWGGPDDAHYINGGKTSGTPTSLGDARGMAGLWYVGLGQLDSLSSFFDNDYGAGWFSVRRTGYLGSTLDSSATYTFNTTRVINGNTWFSNHNYQVDAYHGANPASRYYFLKTPLNRGGGYYAPTTTYVESNWFTNYWSGRNQCTVYGYLY